jgi:hypothetical protein
MSVSGIEATTAVFTQSDVYAVALFRTLIEKGLVAKSPAITRISFLAGVGGNQT